MFKKTVVIGSALILTPFYVHAIEKMLRWNITIVNTTNDPVKVGGIAAIGHCWWTDPDHNQLWTAVQIIESGQSRTFAIPEMV